MFSRVNTKFLCCNNIIWHPNTQITRPFRALFPIISRLIRVHHKVCISAASCIQSGYVKRHTLHINTAVVTMAMWTPANKQRLIAWQRSVMPRSIAKGSPAATAARTGVVSVAHTAVILGSLAKTAQEEGDVKQLCYIIIWISEHKNGLIPMGIHRT